MACFLPWQQFLLWYNHLVLLAPLTRRRSMRLPRPPFASSLSLYPDFRDYRSAVFSLLHVLPALSFQQLTNCFKLNYPARRVHPEPACAGRRSQGSLWQSSTSFHQGTRCLNLATLLHALSFQQLPTIKFSKSFFLITIQIAGGRVGGGRPFSSRITLTAHWIPLCEPAVCTNTAGALNVMANEASLE